MRAGRIERCLAADMTVKERYALNKVAESSLCKRMARFREEDPDRFPAGRAMDWSRFLGRKNKLLQATSRSRSHGAL